MIQYHTLLREILSEGTWRENRTGIRTISLPGAMMRFDLCKGFPAITTRKLAFRSVIGELVGFLRGYTNAADFREIGCNVWDMNANRSAAWLANPYRTGEDDLGPIYGKQWRKWPAYKIMTRSKKQKVINSLDDLGYAQLCSFGYDEYTDMVVMARLIDQLAECVNTIMSNPLDRRILFHAWNPANIEQMALPPCHVLYQFLPNPEYGQLSMTVYLRSNDMGLGAPFNIAESAAMLHLASRITGYNPSWLTIFIGDAHIYENHLPMVRTVLERDPLPMPRLVLSDRIPVGGGAEWLDLVGPEDFVLEGYQHHDPISTPMAV